MSGHVKRVNYSQASKDNQHLGPSRLRYYLEDNYVIQTVNENNNNIAKDPLFYKWFSMLPPRLLPAENLTGLRILPGQIGNIVNHDKQADQPSTAQEIKLATADVIPLNDSSGSEEFTFAPSLPLRARVNKVEEPQVEKSEPEQQPNEKPQAEKHQLEEWVEIESPEAPFEFEEEWEVVIGKSGSGYTSNGAGK